VKSELAFLTFTQEIFKKEWEVAVKICLQKTFPQPLGVGMSAVKNVSILPGPGTLKKAQNKRISTYYWCFIEVFRESCKHHVLSWA
jgi:hypothetical protein